MFRWLSSLKVYADRRMAVLAALGFSSGLPLLLVFSTLTFWLIEEGIDIKTVGLFAAASTPYSLKFLWAPLVDRLPLPWLTRLLGRRRSWMLLTQIGLAVALVGMALTDPSTNPLNTAVWAIVVAAMSATQDIVIDAYRVERLEVDEQGAGGAATVFGYRIGMLAASAGVLYLVAFAQDGPLATTLSALPFDAWTLAYLAMAALMSVGLITTLICKEPDVPPGKAMPELVEADAAKGGEQGARQRPSIWAVFSHHLADGVVGPFKDFLTRRGWYLFLLFIVLFKLGDALAGVMTNPLMVDIGFTKLEIANISKSYGLVATILGVAIGGWVVRATGVIKGLWIAGFLQMGSNLMFTLLAVVGHDPWVLAATIGVENLTGGIGTAAFVAYLSGLCNKSYSATQYALLTALAGILRHLVSASSGVMVDSMGWVNYFLMTTASAIPGLIVLYFLLKLNMTGLTPEPDGNVPPEEKAAVEGEVGEVPKSGRAAHIREEGEAPA